MRGLIWFREDLRLLDNTALHYACKNCEDGVIALYIIDIASWKKHDIAACRVEFILQGLQILQKELATLNIPLLVINIDHPDNINKKISEIINQHKIQKLFFNKQYEIDELKRDKALVNFLEQKNIVCHTYDDQTISPPGSIKNASGDFYKVFTAYKNTWIEYFLNLKAHNMFPKPKKQTPHNVSSSKLSLSLTEFQSTIDAKLWPAGETVALKRLKKFTESDLFSYDKQRDIPNLDTTSRLSPYLAAGMISARKCFLTAFEANNNKLKSGNQGALTWMSELIWRDFYKHLLAAYPRLSMHQPFQEKTKKLAWKHNEKQFTAWCEGKTGFPIIDAAMRQLKQTGWMHNRLRMIVAMFLAKNLFLDWRLGEKYFMQHLIDGDLAANNGGWQWCASTGTDAVPYFRIFNPITQSQKFDNEGKFIRMFCPELKTLDNKSIHMPTEEQARKLNYPLPIVNLKKSREETIQAFKTL